MVTRFQCDANCPNVTRTHNTMSAVHECQSRRRNGGIERASALMPRRVPPFQITTRVGADYSGLPVVHDLSQMALWRPSFAGARMDTLDASMVEGAYLPGADFRGVECPDFVEGVPLYMMTEARGAIVDDEVVTEATTGERAWLLNEDVPVPASREARLAMDFVTPFLQWSFTSSHWNALLDDGYDPDEMVRAAQEFPPLNIEGFRVFLDSGDAVTAASMHPHEEAWGGRPLIVPPEANVRRDFDRARRSA